MTDVSGPRIVAGFGRSGTTWIQDVLARSNNLRAVFEPLHPYLLTAAGLPVPGFHEVGDRDPELHAYLNKFLSEEFFSLWADYRVIGGRLVPRRGKISSISDARRIFRYQRQFFKSLLRYGAQRARAGRITKLVRASMMLSWLQESFDAKIIYVVRHPAAVVVSQMQRPLSWHPRQAIERYRADYRWMASSNTQMAELMSTKLTDIEAHALHWCVEVSTALEQALDCGAQVVFYEELVQQGRPAWQRILQHLDLSSMPDDKLIGMPSQQTWGREARDASQVGRYSLWMQNADQAVLAQIQKILDATSMDLYRVNNAMPVNAGAYR